MAFDTVQDLHGGTSCSEWTGVPLSVLFKETGLQKGASWLVSEGADAGKLSYTLPLAKAMDDVMLAYGQNGEPVRPEQGYPVRLLVPGWEAPHSVKWLRQIKVVDPRQCSTVFQEPSPARSIGIHHYLL
jgi:sulfane dehydrogenase subunit SoxC